MSHDLRQAMGYRHIPASDPEEQRLRDAVFSARTAWVGSNDGPKEAAAMQVAERELSQYLWDRACRQVAADRAKHPKAKRNAPVPKQIEVGSGRVLP